MKQVLKFFVILCMTGVLAACDGSSVEKSSKQEWIAFLAETPRPTVEEITARFDASMQKPNISSSLSFETFYIKGGHVRVYGPPIANDVKSIIAYVPKNTSEPEVLYEP